MFPEQRPPKMVDEDESPQPDDISELLDCLCHFGSLEHFCFGLPSLVVGSGLRCSKAVTDTRLKTLFPLSHSYLKCQKTEIFNAHPQSPELKPH